jgi:glycosyltransferase involved in cell wall biosynthesis
VKKTSCRERLREIIWDIGQKYPIPQQRDSVELLMVNPRLGHVTWHVPEESAVAARQRSRGAFSDAPLVVRIYDVTDIIFDGSNAHMSFDLDVGKLSGNYYFKVDRQGRNYLAETGLRNAQGDFFPLSRSNTAFFDLDKPSGNYRARGLFVGGLPKKIFEVENIFHAPVYERMNRELAYCRRAHPLSVATVFLGIGNGTVTDDPLTNFIEKLSTVSGKFLSSNRLFRSGLKEPGRLSADVLEEVRDEQRRRPFHIIHCHDWYSSAVGLSVTREFGIPMVLTLHSTEHERSPGDAISSLSRDICRRERESAAAAGLVIVPHSSTRQLVIAHYEVPPQKVIVVPDVMDENHSDPVRSAADVRSWFGLNRNAPTVLFAGEISHAAGADLLVEALSTVCRNHRSAQFIVAGDGPLRGELEMRVQHMGIGSRCRFLGDMSKEAFDAVLAASDFVVIPARTWQDEGLARTAIARGLPVLTTHQAGIKCIVHGENGLVTFDNPGSVVWGIQEMLHNPLSGSMLRFVTRKKAGETPSVEIVAAQHYMYYEMLMNSKDENEDG